MPPILTRALTISVPTAPALRASWTKRASSSSVMSLPDRSTPMVVRVLRRAEAANLGPVFVATDAPEIREAVQKAGGRAVMTSPDHGSGSDRIFEALGKIDPEGRVGIVINLQADLPTIASSDIAASLAPLSDATGA